MSHGGWACRHCRTIYRHFDEALECEKACRALARNVKIEMRHVRGGEHTHKQGLAIAYSKTRAAGYKIPRKRHART